jgi:hypothetical protein
MQDERPGAKSQEGSTATSNARNSPHCACAEWRLARPSGSRRRIALLNSEPACSKGRKAKLKANLARAWRRSLNAWSAYRPRYVTADPLGIFWCCGDLEEAQFPEDGCMGCVGRDTRDDQVFRCSSTHPLSSRMLARHRPLECYARCSCNQLVVRPPHQAALAVRSIRPESSRRALSAADRCCASDMA